MKIFVSVLISCWALSTACSQQTKGGFPVDVSAAEDGKLNMTGLVTKYGYPIETHRVKTEDGYVLTMYRIPFGRNCGPGVGGKVPVLVQHGLLSSSYDYLIAGPKKGLGYILADQCYDVWLGNNRGNSESKEHILLKPTDRQFWKFSWHELGKYDLPAMIDRILEVTGHPSLHYIGHSQGTTQFFVFGSLRPEYHQKIRSMHALSPVAFMRGLKSPFIHFLKLFELPLKTVIELIGGGELLPNVRFLNMLGSEICQNKYPELQGICCNILFLLCGFDEPQLNKTILPAIIGHTPAGASIRQALHYTQGIKSGEFRQYDFGEKENLKIYKSKNPPRYEVEKINIPVAFYYGRNDLLADLNDIKKLEDKMPNVVEKFLVPYSKFSHLDFLFAMDIKPLVYNRLLEVMKRY